MSGETIKEFLVGMGFKVDEAGLKTFTSSLSDIGLKAGLVGTAVAAAAGAIFAGVQKIASGYFELDKLASQFRTTTQALDEFIDAGEILGLSEEQTTGSLKHLDKAIADTAMGMGRAKVVFEELGITVTDATGKMRPTTEVMNELALQFKDMEKGRALAIMDRLGLDPALLKLFNADLAELSKDLAEIDKAAGFDLDEAVKNSKEFTSSWKSLKEELNKVRMVFSKVVDSIAVKMMPALTQSIDKFKKYITELRKKVMENLTPIVKFLTSIMNIVMAVAQTFVTTAGVIAGALGLILDYIFEINAATDGLAGYIVAAMVAWKALSLAFTLSPLGILITGIVALVAAIALLIDDFKVWKEGGDSFFDWSAWVGTINTLVATLAFMKQNAMMVFSGLTAAVKSFVNVIIGLFNTLMGVIRALGNILTGDFSGAWRAVKDTVNGVINTFKAAWDVIKGLNTMATGLVKMLPFSTPDAKFTAEHSLEAKKPGGTALYDFSGTKLGQQSAASSSTQNNHVTTNITVQAASNPEMTAKAIANHPAIKNGDMIRNQKSPTR